MHGYDDPGDLWSRLLRRLREERDELVKIIISGTLDVQQYQHGCGRIKQIDETTELIARLHRGEPPAKRPEIRTVED